MYRYVWVAMRSPAALCAEAVALMADVRRARLAHVIDPPWSPADGGGGGGGGGGDSADDSAESAESAEDEVLTWHAREVAAWERAVHATAPPSVAAAVAAALAGDDDDAAVGGALALAAAADDDATTGNDMGDVVRLLRALRRSFAACSRLGRHTEAGVAAGRLVGALVTVLGSDHPECGGALLEAAETAAASDGGGDGPVSAGSSWVGLSSLPG
jgi:hypothetical protein